MVLSLKISTVFDLGIPGILVSWPVVTINIWLIFLLGRLLFGASHERMVLVLAAGVSNLWWQKLTRCSSQSADLLSHI